MGQTNVYFIMLMNQLQLGCLIVLNMLANAQPLIPAAVVATWISVCEQLGALAESCVSLHYPFYPGKLQNVNIMQSHPSEQVLLQCNFIGCLYLNLLVLYSCGGVLVQGCPSGPRQGPGQLPDMQLPWLGVWC